MKSLTDQQLIEKMEFLKNEVSKYNNLQLATKVSL